jgi:hypothetical protein
MLYRLSAGLDKTPDYETMIEMANDLERDSQHLLALQSAARKARQLALAFDSSSRDLAWLEDKVYELDSLLSEYVE